MKLLSTLFFFFLTWISSLGQEVENPQYFLNSKEFDFTKTYINPESIDSLVIKRETQNGELYFYINNDIFPFLTLEDLLKNYTNLKELSDSIFLKINDEYIYDIEGLQFDKSYFVYVNVVDLSKSQYLSDKYKGLKIVEIELEVEEKEPEMRIRGNQEIIDKINELKVGG